MSLKLKVKLCKPTKQNVSPLVIFSFQYYKLSYFLINPYVSIVKRLYRLPDYLPLVSLFQKLFILGETLLLIKFKIFLVFPPVRVTEYGH